MHEFQYLDVFLLASGCKVFRKNCCLRYLNILMLMFILVCYAMTILFSLEKTLETGGIVVLSMMEKYSDEICGLLFIAILSYNRTAMRRILKTIVEDFSDSQKTSLKRHGAVFLVLVFASVALEAMFTYYHLMNRGHQFGLKHATVDWLKCYHKMNSWFIGGCGIYTFFVKIIRFMEINYFVSMDGQHEMFMATMDSMLALERRAVTQDKKNLLRTFAFIPCLWIMHIFIKAPIVWILVSQPDPDLIEVAWRVVPFVFELAAIGYVVYECDVCTCVVQKCSDNLMIFMLEMDIIDQMSLYVRQLERSAEEEFSSWNTIAMNRKFFLGFLCSVVSFSVLFVQLAQKATGTEEGRIPHIPIELMSSTHNISDSSFHPTAVFKPDLIIENGPMDDIIPEFNSSIPWSGSRFE